jgi:hypothetical protein
VVDWDGVQNTKMTTEQQKKTSKLSKRATFEVGIKTCDNTSHQL